MSFDDQGPELEPKGRGAPPTIVWVMIGLVVVVIFATIIALRGGQTSPRAVGPPAGAPASEMPK